MAKKASKTKKKKGARRVGALNPNSGVMKLAAVAVGYFLADTINGAIDKVLPASIVTPTDPASLMKYAPSAVQLGLGGFLLMSKGKASIVKTAGGGILAGAGLKRALRSAGVITGYQATPVIGRAQHRMAGYQSTPVIGNVPAQLAGVPAQLQGYRVNGYTPAGSGVMGAVNSRYGADGNGSGSGVTNSTDPSSGYMG